MFKIKKVVCEVKSLNLCSCIVFCCPESNSISWVVAHCQMAQLGSHRVFYVLNTLLLSSWLVIIQSQPVAPPQVQIDVTTGLVYFLIVFFFAVNYCTPFLVWTYVTYLAVIVEKAEKEAVKLSKRLTERLSDAGRKVNQSIRSN